VQLASHAGFIDQTAIEGLLFAIGQSQQNRIALHGYELSFRASESETERLRNLQR
jgi:hypothetical protein